MSPLVVLLEYEGQLRVVGWADSDGEAEYCASCYFYEYLCPQAALLDEEAQERVVSDLSICSNPPLDRLVESLNEVEETMIANSGAYVVRYSVVDADQGHS